MKCTKRINFTVFEDQIQFTREEIVNNRAFADELIKYFYSHNTQGLTRNKLHVDDIICEVSSHAYSTQSSDYIQMQYNYEPLLVIVSLGLYLPIFISRWMYFAWMKRFVVTDYIRLKRS